MLVAPCTSSLYKQGSRPKSSIAVDPSDSLGYLLALLSVVQTSLVVIRRITLEERKNLAGSAHLSIKLDLTVGRFDLTTR